MFAEVAIPDTGFGNFTYKIPPALQKILKPGTPVIVPLRRNLVTGMVVEISRSASIPSKKVKDIKGILDPAFILTPELFQLLCWVADYYICPAGDVFRAAYPPGTMARLKMYLEAAAKLPSDNKHMLIYNLVRNNPGRYIYKNRGQIIPGVPLSQIKRMLAEGYLYLTGKVATRGSASRLVAVACYDSDIQSRLDKLSAEIKTLYAIIKERPSGLPLTELPEYGFARKDANYLYREKLVRIVRRKLESVIPPPIGKLPPLTLNHDQADAKTAITKALETGINKSFLLYGITGSGKTQVYIEAARHALSLGKSVLILVPEISLTPQAVVRFSQALEQPIGVWHSEISAGQRVELFHKANLGDLRVILGVRSAVFAPLRNLGLIVIDEEQDDSYKQSDPAPRYNARDVALMRGRLEKAVVILGSATPSLESYHNAIQNKHQLLRLTKRVAGGPLPKPLTINLRTAEIARDMWPLSEPFIERICWHVAEGNQVILLLNRRGYSGMLLCRSCGQPILCSDCKVAMTYHKSVSKMICHYCGASKSPPDRCEECSGVDFDYGGIGTQKLEELLRGVLGDKGIIRMDSDSTRGKGMIAKIISAFEMEQSPVLIGTKMVAKGHHFPKVGMVGVVLADSGLHLPDFRATEKVFSLLVQAAGRAGRSEFFSDGGEFVIQSFNSSSWLMEIAAAQDYESFFRIELDYRRELSYPPFGKIIRCVVQGDDDSYTRWAARSLAREISQNLKTIKILGPAATAVFRMSGKYNYQLLLKGKFPNEFKKWLAHHVENRHIFKDGKVKIKIDVDPREMI